jgi:hypothetical protein
MESTLRKANLKPRTDFWLLCSCRRSTVVEVTGLTHDEIARLQTFVLPSQIWALAKPIMAQLKAIMPNSFLRSEFATG